MKDNVLLAHKVMTGEASKNELEEYGILLNGNIDFGSIVNDLKELMSLTNDRELPFEVDVDAAFNRFADITNLSGGNKVMDKSIVIDINRDRTIEPKTDNFKTTTKVLTISNIMKIAAIFLVAVGSIFILNQDKGVLSNNQVAEVSFSHSNSEGIVSHVLIDKSTVVLGTGAELLGMKGFNDSKREVRLLKGEAFFKISKNTNKPFIVNMGEVAVLVTGTAFDIDNNNTEIVISVEEGSVNVTSKTESFNLILNDKLVYNKKSKTFRKGQVESDNVFSWVNKELYFESTPLNIVFDDISRFYQVDITYPASADKCSYTSPLFKDKTLDKVLKTVALAFNLKIIKLKNNEIKITEIRCN